MNISVEGASRQEKERHIEATTGLERSIRSAGRVVPVLAHQSRSQMQSLPSPSRDPVSVPWQGSNRTQPVANKLGFQRQMGDFKKRIIEAPP